MNIKSKNIKIHIAYWIFVVIILTIVFGISWGNKRGAFYFVSMLLPVVLSTSYFFNYFLVPRYYLTRRYYKFTIYTLCTAIFSLHLELLVLLYSYLYVEKFSIHQISPNAIQTVMLGIVLYLIVFIGSFLLMMHQIVEHKKVIQQLLAEKKNLSKSFLEIVSNRKTIKIPYADIIYIESLSDYIKVITIKNETMSKERISKLVSRLPDTFLRIHRSYIINSERIKELSSNEVLVDNVKLNIGRSYRKEIKEKLNAK